MLALNKGTQLVYSCITYLSLAEATSCRAAIRVAKGVVSDIGEDVAAASSAGFAALAQCAESHSERGASSVISKKFKLSVPIQLTELPKAPGVTYKGEIVVLRLRDWLQFMVDFNCWHIFAGLKAPDEKRERSILKEFWRLYRAHCPNHSMWGLVDSNQLDVSRCAPLLLHGDEGRGKKRAGFLVVSFHSVLGLGTEQANKSRVTRAYKSMKLNYSSSTYTTRLLSSVLPKMTKDGTALESILRFVAEDCIDVLQTGVLNKQNKKFFAAVLHCTGDWVWLAKSGHLTRSFSNIEKRPRAKNSKPKGFCHYCLAGTLEYPFENFQADSLPVWWATMFTTSPFQRPSPLMKIPYIPGEEPGFFTFDLFHSYHLGVGKTFMAACLALASECMSRTNQDQRFEQLTEIFLGWCQEQHREPYLTAISTSTIGWANKSQFPNGMWSKGSLTTTLSDFFGDWSAAQDLSPNSLLDLSRQANHLISECLRGMFASDVWLSKDVAARIAEQGLSFLALYGRMAFQSYQDGRALFSLMPKAHALHHIMLNLKLKAADPEVECCLNPLTVSVQLSEDYVGRNSRVARKVGVQQSIKRVIQRNLAATYAHWVEAGYLKQ